jgi:hypothetical protein
MAGQSQQRTPWLRLARRLLIPATCLAVTAVVVLLLIKGTVGVAIGLGLAGIAGVLAIESAFLAVGRSEDLDRDERVPR